MKTDAIWKYLESIGKERAHEMTGVQIHDAIYDECGKSFVLSTILDCRQKFTGIAKKPGNRGQFNRFKSQ